ncbi:MAG: acyltransferase family protein [Ruminococcus sp.]
MLKSNISNKRNSSIELLKVLAVVMIVFSHAIPNSGDSSASSYIDLSMATNSIQQLILVFMKYAGQLGNDIFIVCSAWFLLESKRAKADKVFHIILDSFFISVIFLVLFILAGYKLSVSEIVKNLIPITMNNNWFVGCYILFYLIHPVLNTVISSITKKQLLVCNLVTGFLYCGVNLMIHDRYYYTQLVGFICIYLFVAYIKIYMTDFIKNKAKNIACFCISALCLIGFLVLFNIIGLKVDALNGYVVTWSIIINPFIIIMSVTVFNLVNNHYFHNRVVNYLSGLSLLIYIIHGNRILQDHFKMNVFAKIYAQYSYQYILGWVIVFGFALLIFGTVAAMIYSATLQKLVYFLYSKAKKGLSPVLSKAIRFLSNIK